jgi:hypothetical protein
MLTTNQTSLRLVAECLGEGADLSIVLGRAVSMPFGGVVLDDHREPRTVVGLGVFEYLPRATECRVSLSPPGGSRFVRRLTTICCGIAASAFFDSVART